MTKKVYLKVFGCQMDAVLYDYYSVSESNLVTFNLLNLKRLREGS